MIAGRLTDRSENLKREIPKKYISEKRIQIISINGLKIHTIFPVQNSQNKEKKAITWYIPVNEVSTSRYVQ